jgi:hypothetical protein
MQRQRKRYLHWDWHFVYCELTSQGSLAFDKTGVDFTSVATVINSGVNCLFVNCVPLQLEHAHDQTAVQNEVAVHHLAQRAALPPLNAPNAEAG